MFLASVILCNAEDSVLLVQIVKALQVMLDSQTDTIRTLSLKINVQKSWHTFFRHKKKTLNVKIDNELLKTFTGCKYFGVVLPNDLSCTKLLQEKFLGSSNKFFSLWYKFYCTRNVFLWCWIVVYELHTKVLNCISIA